MRGGSSDMKKRFFIILLATVLSGCMLTACSGNSGSSQQDAASVESSASFEPVDAMRFTKGLVSVTEQGFLTSSSLLTLSAPDGAAIYYTTDGSEPDTSAMQYTEPIPFQGLVGNFPNSIVLKARAYFEDGSVSEVGTRTFFCASDVKNRYKHVIFSITGDPKQLTEGPDGILFGDNVELRGKESERKVYVEAINRDGSVIFEQYAGARVYGAASRLSAIKSLKLFARKEYDPDHGQFDIDVFGTTGADGAVIPEYDKLVLRNYGNDFQFAFVRDELNQRLAAKAGYTDCEAVVPALVYLNGAYYGLMYLHETYCDDLFKDKYGAGNGKYEVLEGKDGKMNVEEEDAEMAAIATTYNTNYEEFSKADLLDDTIYAQLCAFMDVENYLQNFAFNIYVNNNDWPQNNFKCYRYFAAEGESLGTAEARQDGRWRYLYHDIDFCFSIYEMEETGASYNNLAQILDADSDRYSPLFAKLMERPDCRDFFLAEMQRLMNGALSADSIIETLDHMTTERFFEMRYYFEYLENLKKKNSDIWIWYEEYQRRTDNIRVFARQRAAYMEQFLKEAFAESADQTELPDTAS